MGSRARRVYPIDFYWRELRWRVDVGLEPAPGERWSGDLFHTFPVVLWVLGDDRKELGEEQVRSILASGMAEFLTMTANILSQHPLYPCRGKGRNVVKLEGGVDQLPVEHFKPEEGVVYRNMTVEVFKHREAK